MNVVYFIRKFSLENVTLPIDYLEVNIFEDIINQLSFIVIQCLSFFPNDMFRNKLKTNYNNLKNNIDYRPIIIQTNCIM